MVFHVGTAPWDTIPALIEDAARRFGHTEAFSEGAVSLDFAGLATSIRRAQKSLMRRGVERGDRVAIWAPNCLEWIQAALAVHCAGGVLVPVNTRFKGPEAADVIRRSGARLVFTVTSFLGTNYAARLQEREDIEAVEEVIVLGGPAGEGETSFEEFLAEGSVVTDSECAERAGAVRGDDLCHVLFTSGTTGRPKGVMLEHRAVCTAYNNLADVFGMRYGDRQLVVLPFFHSFGLHVGILCGFMRGISILPQQVFDPEAVMRRIQEDRVTLFPGPPTIFQSMIANPQRDDYDLSSLRCVTIGAAGFPPSLVDGIVDRLGVPEVRNGFGITESSGIVTLVPAGQPREVVATTVGRPLPGIEVKTVGGDGATLPPGGQGELLVRGYTIMRGYLDDPEATREAVDPDGWLHTGDVGYLRSDGNLVITDRIKDMFAVGGFNAYPAEIEAAMARHPSIAQVAVIGVPDERLGEVGMAFVVLAGGRPPSDRENEEILAWTRREIANFKVPRYVEFVDALPLNATGKVLKTELRKIAAAGSRG
jgi:HIP---CoA ligase